jgi:crossover junction endodeoxyribonuclease RuvC
MAYTGQILALDLAAKTGWAVGRPGGVPLSGSVNVAPIGATLGRTLSGCREWLLEFVGDKPSIRYVVFEAPLNTRWIKSPRRPETERQLIGLVSVVEEALYSKGGYDVREARVADVRIHFLGSNKHKREEAKRLTIMGCRIRGWNPVDDNAADALALWDYQCSLLMRRVA